MDWIGVASAPIKVMHVVPDLGPGGAGLGVQELARLLARSGQAEVRLCVLGHKQSRQDTDDACGVTYLGIANPTASLTALRQCVRRLSELVHREAVDIVHSHLLPADLVSAFAVAGARNILHTAHVRDTRTWLSSKQPRHIVKKWMFRVAFSMARTQFIAVSKDAAMFAARHFGIPAGRMRIVLNGIDAAPFAEFHARRRDWRSRSVVIGATGRLVPEKDHATLIAATARALRARHDVRLEIAGTGSRQANLIALAEAEGMGDRLVMRGHVSDMPDFYSGLDIFVLPSHSSEGLPRVLLEAMAAGLPVIATRTEGVGDVVVDGQNGLTVQKQNPDAMAAAMMRLIEDRELAQHLGENGRRRVLEHFTAERVAGDVARHYRWLIDHDGAAVA